MTSGSLDRLHLQLLYHEGLRLRPYRDSVGKLTIGIGRNLDDRGITRDEALALLNDDIALVENQLTARFPWFARLDPIRQRVMLDLAFNVGIGTLATFKRTIAAIAAGDYTTASDCMLKSLWAKEVGQRAIRLAHMMRTGEDSTDF